jgi:hypothetical protein
MRKHYRMTTESTEDTEGYMPNLMTLGNDSLTIFLKRCADRLQAVPAHIIH